jgi:hypothetical protein
MGMEAARRALTTSRNIPTLKNATPYDLRSPPPTSRVSIVARNTRHTQHTQHETTRHAPLLGLPLALVGAEGVEELVVGARRDEARHALGQLLDVELRPKVEPGQRPRLRNLLQLEPALVRLRYTVVVCVVAQIVVVVDGAVGLAAGRVGVGLLAGLVGGEVSELVAPLAELALEGLELVAEAGLHAVVVLHVLLEGLDQDGHDLGVVDRQPAVRALLHNLGQHCSPTFA